MAARVIALLPLLVACSPHRDFSRTPDRGVMTPEPCAVEDGVGAVEPIGAPCMAGIGACAASGVIVCIGDKRVCDARPHQREAESCNGIDDDCDGRVDEGLDEQSCPTESPAAARSGRAAYAAAGVTRNRMGGRR